MQSAVDLERAFFRASIATFLEGALTIVLKDRRVAEEVVRAMTPAERVAVVKGYIEALKI